MQTTIYKGATIMENYVIITESTCDATYEIAQRSGLDYVAPMNFSVDGKDYYEYQSGRDEWILDVDG
jgi:fatty acid-binding protein DegV